MRHTPTRNRPPQRIRDVRLDRNVGKPLWAILAGKGEIQGAKGYARDERLRCTRCALKRLRQASTKIRHRNTNARGRTWRPAPARIPQVLRDSVHHTYRCYLRGPDGISELPLPGT
jgi:hypothetical protein